MLFLYRMSLKETVDTFSYFISEADKLGLAYIVLVRYTEMSDPVFDGSFRFIYRRFTIAVLTLTFQENTAPSNMTSSPHTDISSPTQRCSSTQASLPRKPKNWCLQRKLTACSLDSCGLLTLMSRSASNTGSLWILRLISSIST